MVKKQNNQVEKLLKTISIYEGDIPIKSKIHEEYISYHGKINLDEYNYEETIKQSEILFDKTTPDAITKKMLFLLGEFATPESFQILKRYIDEKELTQKEWALLAMQELRFHIENEIYDEERDMIMSPVGGKGNMLRYYVVVSKKQVKQFTQREKEFLKHKLSKIADKMQSEIEELEFFGTYVLIKMLTSVDVASGDVIDKLLDKCKDFLRYHYFMINTHKPTENEINQYLEMDKVRKL